MDNDVIEIDEMKRRGLRKSSALSLLDDDQLRAECSRRGIGHVSEPMRTVAETDEATKKLTLGDLERIATRFSKAVREIREGQAMLGGNSSASTDSAAAEPEPAAIEDAAAAHRRRQFQPPEQPSNGRSVLRPDELAHRNSLLRSQRGPVDPNLPDDIRRAMESE